MTAYNNEQVSILQDEKTNDPLTRGYSAMTDQQFMDSMNTADLEQERTSMSSGEIMEQISGAEFAALTAAETARVDRVLGLGADVIIGPGNLHNAVQELIAVFGGISLTIIALDAARSISITRAQELGIPAVNLSVMTRLI